MYASVVLHFHHVTPRLDPIECRSSTRLIAAITITITIRMSDTSVDNGTMIMDDRVIKISYRD